MLQVLVNLSESAYKEMCENGIDNVDYDIRRMIKGGIVINRNLCDSCINNGCIFQSGIVRNHCDFYIRQEERPLTEDDYAYCGECDHVEMCRWYPMYGCEFKSRPSAEPERKKWKWIHDNPNTFRCSECNKYLDISCGNMKMNFCPNCGADMRGEQDDTD